MNVNKRVDIDFDYDRTAQFITCNKVECNQLPPSHRLFNMDSHEIPTQAITYLNKTPQTVFHYQIMIGKH